MLIIMLLGCSGSQQAVNNRLYTSVLHGDARGVLKAAEQGALINLQEPDRGWTPLLFATEAQDVSIVRLLLNFNADPNITSSQEKITPLHRAAALGNDLIVRLLIDHGADLNLQDSRHRSTPLMWAAANGHHKIAEQLLQRQALINVRGNRGESALYLAVSNGDAEMVALLLAYGAIKDRPDIYDVTPLQKAQQLGQMEIVDLLKNNL